MLKSSCSHREESRRDEHVMAGGDQGADAILPFKAHRDIDRDHRHGQDRGDDAVVQQFAGNLGSHHFGAAVLIARAQLALDRARPRPDRPRSGRRPSVCLCGWTRIRTQLLAGRSHSPPPKYCSCRIVEAQRDDVAAHLADIDHLGRLHLHQHAAGEVDAQIEAVPERSRRSRRPPAARRCAKAKKRYLTKSTLVVSGMNRRKVMPPPDGPAWNCGD